nr:phosphopantetheine-binding protein [Nocardia transvalensis]
MRAVIADLLGVTAEEVPLDADLHVLGVTSIGMLRLANRWRRLGLEISYAELASEPTLNAWRRRLAPEPRDA